MGLRQISEQELKDILDKHGRWFRNEEGGERANLSRADLSSVNLSRADLSYADLSHADLRYADLSSVNLISADLSYADLSYADLRYADLSYADLRSADLSHADLLRFQFRKHEAFYTFDGALRIGCILMPVSEWVLGFEEIGKTNGYSAEEIQMYGAFIKMCEEHFKGQVKP